jgi:hypothetical protein
MPLPAVLLTEELIAEHERLLSSGVGVTEACAALRMSTATYYKWANTGEFSESGSPCREFYDRVVVPRRNLPRKLRKPRKPASGPRGPYKTRKDKGRARLTSKERHLSEADLVGLLEALARDGNVRAIQLLLERPWDKGRNEESEPENEFDALDNVTVIRRGA